MLLKIKFLRFIKKKKFIFQVSEGEHKPKLGTIKQAFMQRASDPHLGGLHHASRGIGQQFGSCKQLLGVVHIDFRLRIRPHGVDQV